MFKFEKVVTENYSKNPVAKNYKYGLFYYSKGGSIYTIFMIKAKK